MANGLNYCVKAETATLVLNTIYAIFLGLLFTFFFDQDVQNGGVSSVYFLVSKRNWIPVVSISIYFLLDWLTTNLTVTLKGAMNHLLLIVMVLLISYLGGLVVLAFAPQTELYLLFAIYASIVPWWDLFLKVRDPSSAEGAAITKANLVSWALILCRICVGVFMLLQASLDKWLDHPATGQGLSNALLITYVILKLVRYFAYVHYELAASRQTEALMPP